MVSSSRSWSCLQRRSRMNGREGPETEPSGTVATPLLAQDPGESRGRNRLVTTTRQDDSALYWPNRLSSSPSHL